MFQRAADDEFELITLYSLLKQVGSPYKCDDSPSVDVIFPDRIKIQKYVLGEHCIPQK